MAAVACGIGPAISSAVFLATSEYVPLTILCGMNAGKCFFFPGANLQPRKSRRANIECDGSDYLFFRNCVPDFSKLQANLRPAQGKSDPCLFRYSISMIT